MHLPLKRLLHIAGSLLAIAAIFFMAVRLQSYLDRIDFSALLATLWGSILALSCCVSLCNFLLVSICFRCLEYPGVSTSYSSATWSYGISQLGKYIPGNIFHLAGRQTLGMAENLPGGMVLRSMFWGWPSWRGRPHAFSARLLWRSIFPLHCRRCGLQEFSPIAALPCLMGWGGYSGQHCKRPVFGASRIYAAWAAFFLSFLHSSPRLPSPPWSFFAGTAYVAAWFIGLVTPGAPAGLGMRKGAMLFIMKGMPLPEADLLLAVLLGATIIILGDFLFFLDGVGVKYVLR